MKDYLLNTVIPECQLAYDIQRGNVTSTTDMSGVELIKGNPISSPKHSKSLIVMLESGVVFGYLRVSPDKKSLLISFRGSVDWMDWEDNIEAIPVRSNYEAGWVHSGFQEVYASIHDSLWSILEKYYNVPSIEIVGHSLGGALAVLAGIEIEARRIPKTIPIVTTLAQPAVLGVQPFHLSLNPITFPEKSLTRIMNRYDIVPHLPLPPTFQHRGVRVNVNGCIPELNIAHSLSNYKIAIEKMTDVVNQEVKVIQT